MFVSVHKELTQTLCLVDGGTNRPLQHIFFQVIASRTKTIVDQNDYNLPKTIFKGKE